MIALAVVSHWILDAISHRPDMPVVPGIEIKVGLGLWNSPAATMIVEGVMFTAGVWLYGAGSRSIDRIGSIGFWAYVGLLVAVYIANALGPPPPSANAVAISRLGLFLFVLWAWWFDRQRTMRK